MRQTRAKLNWYKITWKWHRNTSIGDLVKDSYFGSHKGNVKTVIGNSSNNIQVHMANTPKPHVIILPP